MRTTSRLNSAGHVFALNFAVCAVTFTFVYGPASADVIWKNGSPIFNSDKRARNEQISREKRRAALRNRYYRRYPAIASGGPRPSIAPVEPPIVPLSKREKPGTIIIDTADRRLYYVISEYNAYEYPISVGRDGFRWTGNKVITRMRAWPSWHPPAEMHARQPGLPKKMTGGLRNPLGAKALYLGNSLYRIHGTNDRKTIGRAASSGCFRMMNAHVIHLASVAGVGTKVRVLRRYDGAAPLKMSQTRLR